MNIMWTAELKMGQEAGSGLARPDGVPQGSTLCPVLVNLFITGPVDGVECVCSGGGWGKSPICGDPGTPGVLGPVLGSPA